MSRTNTREILRRANSTPAQIDNFGKQCKSRRAFGHLLFGLAMIGVAVAAGRLAAQTSSGSECFRSRKLYQQRCAQCHENAAANRAPSREALQKMPASRILRTLDFGLMMGVAYPLTREERSAVANYLGTTGTEPGPPPAAFCRPNGIRSRPNRQGIGMAGARRLQIRAFRRAGGITAEQVSQLKLKWAYGFAGDVTAFAAPTVLNGTVFVGSAGGVVQAVEAKTGCMHWAFQANGPVRSAIVAVANGSDYSAFVRRPDRLVLFARREDGQADLEAPRGRTRGHAADGLAGRARRCSIYRRGVLGGKPGGRTAL